MDEVTCPICGEKLPNRMRLGSHMWTAHKTKLKEYEAKQQALYEAHTTDGLIKPSVVTESKEFVTETKQTNDGLMPNAPKKQDNDIVVPPVQTETTIPQSNLLNENEIIRTTPDLSKRSGSRQMSADYNPYKEMYGNDYADNGVYNEFLGRRYGK